MMETKKNHMGIVMPYRANGKEIGKNLKALELQKFGLNIGLPLTPRFMDESAALFLERKSQELIRLLLRVKKILQKRPELRKEIGLTETEEEWFLMDSILFRGLDIVRLDSFFDGANLKFLEINTNAPDGIGGEDAVANIFASTTLENISNYKRQSLDKATARYLKGVLKKAYPGKNGLNVFIAVDGKNDLEIKCIEFAMDAFRQEGLNCSMGKLSNLIFEDVRATYKGQTQHMIFRRFDLNWIEERSNEFVGLFRLIRRKKVLFVNPLSDSILGHKAIFALLSDPKFKDCHSRNLKPYLPWTRILKNEKSTDPAGKGISTIAFTQKNRRQLVLKASVGTEGKQVFIGREMKQGDWLRQIESIQNSNCTWIVQEFVEATYGNIIVSGNKGPVMKRVLFDVDPHMINKKLVCVLSRWGIGSNILNFFKGNSANVFFSKINH